MAPANSSRHEADALKASHETYVRYITDQYEADIARIGEEHTESIARLNKTHESETADLRMAVQNHQQEFRQLKEVHDDKVKQLNANVEAQKADLAYNKEARRVENSALEEGRKKAEKTIAKLTAALQSHNKNLTELQKTWNRDLQSEIGVLKASLTNMEAERDQATAKRKLADNKDIEIKQQEIRRLKHEVAGLISQMDEMKTTMQKESKEMKAQITACKKQRDKLRSDQLKRKRSPSPGPSSPLEVVSETSRHISQRPPINIWVRGAKRPRKQFQIMPNAKLWEMMVQHAKGSGHDTTGATFEYNGVTIRNDDTAYKLGIEDKEEIDFTVTASCTVCTHSICADLKRLGK